MRRSRRILVLAAALAVSAPGFATRIDEEQIDYPDPGEAREAYDWLHKRVASWIQAHPGWAISEFEAKPESFPPGVLSRIEATPGWATFGLALPEGEARKAVRVGSFDTQTDVKVVWPDGSIRFAVITAKIDKKGDFDLVHSESETGEVPFQARSDLEVRLDLTDGDTLTARIPSTPSEDLWLSGPLAQEWRFVVAPEDSAGKPHPFLRVLFDYRIYRDRQARVDITVENTLDLESARAVTYDVQILSSGERLFEKVGVVHPYLTRWRAHFGLQLASSMVVPNFESAYRAGAVPRFLTSIAKTNYPMGGTDFEILGKGGNSYRSMSATGGRSELACYPDSTAQYLVFRTRSLHQYLLVNGDLAGSWPVHIREKDGRLVSIQERPAFWLDTRGKDQPAGDMQSRGPLKPDNAHQPSWAYVPYLVTGDRYYADEMAFWANYVVLSTWPNRRGGEGAGGYGDNAGHGLIGPGNQVRALAWGLRNLIDAAAYLPDSYPEKPYFVQLVHNNLEWADAVVEDRGVLPTGAFGLKVKNGYVALWQENYVGWALDRAHQQGFAGGGTLLRVLSGFQSRLFTSEPDFSRKFAAPYSLQLGTKREEGEIDYFQTMAELFSHNNSEPSKWNRDYAASARIMLLIRARPDGQRKR